MDADPQHYLGPGETINVWERDREPRPLLYDAHGTPLIPKEEIKRRIGFEDDNAISI